MKFALKLKLGQSRGEIWIQIPVGGEAAVKFESKFQLGAKPRCNLDSNFSWGRRRGGIWIQISAGGDVEVEFGSKFQLGVKPRWNLRSYYNRGRSRGEI